MPRFVVVKVKYGDTLRRFNASVNEERRFDLNMEGFRLRICSLFNLPSDANFSLTYTDEDNDLVTLADDEDLLDVVSQNLNPVRITVDLKTDNTSASGACSPLTGSSSNSQQKSTPNAAEVFSSIDALIAKLSTELTSSKAASTSPLLSDLLDGLSKMGHSYLNASCSDSDNTSPASGARSPLKGSSSSSQQKTTPSAAEVFSSVDALIAKLSAELTSKAASTSPLLSDLLDGLSKIGQSYLNASRSDFGSTKDTNVSGDAGGSDGPKQEAPNAKLDASVDGKMEHNNVQTPCFPQQSSGNIQETREAEAGKPLPSYSHKGKNENTECDSCKLPPSRTSKKDKELIEDSARFKLRHHILTNYQKNYQTSGSTLGDNRSFPLGEISFPRRNLPVPSMGKYVLPHPPPPYPPGSHWQPFFHKGVRCDGCGALPIVGSRFKSKVKHDYDLCSVCFGRMGNDVDYDRFDSPLFAKEHRNSMGCNDAFHDYLHIPPSTIPSMIRRPSGKHSRSKLDSRFIMDVNVMDGTVMAPLTPFTKIWRMRNNGTLQWKRGLRLVWIGGDRFSSADAVEIELPDDGVSVGKEIDIAADFVAPELPGRYVSYWRMADPTGVKFGQRVWVLVQVDASVDLTNQSSPELNLNIHPESDGALGPVLDDNEPVPNVEVGDLRSTSKIEQIEDLNFPINNDLVIASDVICPTSAASSSAMCSTGADNFGISEAPHASNLDVTANGNHEPPSAPPANLFPINNSDLSSASCSVARSNQSNLVQDNGKLDVEETLLKELEEMGFKQIDLNKKVLRVNDYNLEQSVDDLCGVSEWDPILEELREMGFEDKETNKKLLAKNNGSITRVVMDLIAGEKPQ